MSILDSHSELMHASEITAKVTTTTSNGDALSASPAVNYHSQWEDVINHQLVEWGRDASAIEDEGLDPPTHKSLQLAVKIAHQLRDQNYPVARVVANGTGGISFSWRFATGETVSCVCQDDGQLDWLEFKNGRLTDRR